MCPWQWMDGQGPSGQCSPGQEWWIQLHLWIAVINRVVAPTARWQPRAPAPAGGRGVGGGGEGGPRCGERRGEGGGGGRGLGQTLECGSIRRAGVYTSPCRAAPITKGGWSALMPTGWEGFIFHVREPPPPPPRYRLRTSTRRLDKSRLCIVLGGGPSEWNVPQPLRRRGEALKHWPWPEPVTWMRYGPSPRFPWTVTTLNPTTF